MSTETRPNTLQKIVESVKYQMREDAKRAIELHEAETAEEITICVNKALEDYELESFIPVYNSDLIEVYNNDKDDKLSDYFEMEYVQINKEDTLTQHIVKCISMAIYCYLSAIKDNLREQVLQELLAELKAN